MFIASFFVFMLLHQIVVCDELYPISVAVDIAQNQPEWSSNRYIEPLGDYTHDVAPQASNSPQSDLTDKEDLKWMKTDIVDRYKFVKDPRRDIWIQQPDFKADLGTAKFIKDADRVTKFFKRNNDWEKTKKNPEYRTKDSCTNLLYITAARYLLVTHILYQKSDKKLIPCVRTRDNKIDIPASGICYPAPYGSATCTSDYDVGLVGKNAGYITEKFNAFFQSEFGKPSELVFDTNVYAFTLEYAMPSILFAKLPANFASVVAKDEQTINFRMQELASAYYKVFKYNKHFFDVMVAGALKAMTAPKSKRDLEVWLDTFRKLNDQVPMKLEDYLNSPQMFRSAHNDEYQKLVKEMSKKGGYNPRFLGDLAKALIYAAEAYHTRGAIRHVVGGTQMKVVDTSKSLTLNDVWVSMIENWGESNKEYNHCSEAPLEECFLKMSKYMWRMFNAMRLVRQRLPPAARVGLVHFGEQFRDPEFAMTMWLDYKKQGKTAIPKQRKNVESFLSQFRCHKVASGKPLPSTCISAMNEKVNAYNIRLAGIVTDDPAKPPWRP